MKEGSYTEQDSRYLFAVGYIRTKEKELFDAGFFNRLIENSSLEGLRNELSDTKYKQYILSENDLRKALGEYLVSSYEYIKSKVPDSRVLDVFMFKRDVANFVNFIKTKEENLYISGVYKKQSWAVIGGSIPEIFKETEARARKQNGMKTLEDAPDAALEKAGIDTVYELWVEGCLRGKLLEYWKYTIDIKNILQNIFHGRTTRLRRSFYLKGGNIEENFWSKVSIDENIPGKIKGQSYMKFVAGEKDYGKWEHRLTKFTCRLLKEMRRITFGPEPVVSYLMCLAEEIKNINLIYTGIEMGMDRETMKQGLNLDYV